MEDRKSFGGGKLGGGGITLFESCADGRRHGGRRRDGRGARIRDYRRLRRTSLAVVPQLGCRAALVSVWRAELDFALHANASNHAGERAMDDVGERAMGTGLL